MSEIHIGDNVSGGGVQYKQSGASSTFTVHNSGQVSQAELDRAVSELRVLISQLTQAGAVAPDGTVRDPAAVVAAVETQPSKLKALAQALAGGAKDAILTVVREGVATLIVALVARS